MLQRLTIISTLAFMLSGCAAMEPSSTSSSAIMEAGVAGVASSAAAQEPTALSSSAAGLAETIASDDSRLKPTLYPGTDQHVKLPPAQTPVKFFGEDVSLNFEQAPLGEVMHAIMGDILALDYIVDHPVQGKVTLRTRTPVPRDQLLGILESLLKANGSLMIRGNDNRYLISGSKIANRLAPGVSSADQLNAGYSTIVVPLRFISAANMEEILRPVAEESAFVRVDNSRNLLMLAGTSAQLSGWLEMIATFDVDLLKGMSIGLFPLENSSVEEMNDVLIGLLGKGGAAADLSGLVRIIPITRLNSILVVTPRAHYLDQVGVWIERFDGTPDSNFEKRLYVYPVQNTNALRLADLLSRIYSGEGGGSRSRGASGGGSGGGFGQNQQADVAPGMTPETLGGGTSAGSGIGGSGSMSKGAASFGSNPGGGGTTSEYTLSDVRVVADEESNALMIYATGKEYKKIKVALDQLDIVPTQVIIEASILEVSLTDELKYGLEWTFKNGLGSDYDGLGVLASAASGPAAVVPGFSYTVTNSIGDISAVLNALASQSLINVISTPSVMVLDNHIAYIHVGDQVPIATSASQTDGGTVTQNVEYKDTGVKLTVRPSVNAGGLVTMDIEQSVTDVGLIDEATGQRTFLERNIMSRVAVRSGESVVLGGLIRENASVGESGIPFLYKLPIIGPLFGSTTISDRRTELLVIITPTAIYNESELREVSAEMRSHIRHMELIDLPGESE